MAFELATVAADLETRLKDALPDWTIRNADLTAKSNSLAVVLAYEQLHVSCEYDGQRLAAGWTATDFQLVLSAPEMDPVKGTARVMANLPALLVALDGMDDLAWDRAEKGRDQAGTFYALPVTVFTTYPEPETTEE